MILYDQYNQPIEEVHHKTKSGTTRRYSNGVMDWVEHHPILEFDRRKIGRSVQRVRDLHIFGRQAQYNLTRQEQGLDVLSLLDIQIKNKESYAIIISNHSLP